MTGKLPLVYLACPYADPSPAVRERRWILATAATAALMRSGERMVYSPITMTHFLPALGVPTAWEFWEPQSLQFLERCDELVVLGAEGWRTSVGVQAEIAHARKLGLPISFLPSYQDLDPVPFHGALPG